MLLAQPPPGGPGPEVMIVLFPAVVAVLCGVVVAVAVLSQRGLLPALDERIALGTSVTVVAAGLSFAAAAVNNALSGSVLPSDPTLGTALVLTALFQVAWGVLYLALPTAAIAAFGLIANDGIVLLWAWSRTVGLPFGSSAGGPEPIGLRDAVAAAFEVLLIALLAARLAPQLRPLLARTLRFGDATIVTAFGLLVIAAATGVVIATPDTSG